jgi:tRNA-dihydrouridine synthase B
MLGQSGADAVMIGRGAYGRPWMLAALAEPLDKGSGRRTPLLHEQRLIVLHHYEAMLSHYGLELGQRIARKHLGWYVEDLKTRNLLTEGEARSWRQALVREEHPSLVRKTLHRLYDRAGFSNEEAA